MQILAFIGFTAFVAIISYLYTRNTNESSSDGYFLGGRSLTGVVIAGSLLLTNLSTEQIVGLNGAAFKEGLLALPTPQIQIRVDLYFHVFSGRSSAAEAYAVDLEQMVW